MTNKILTLIISPVFFLVGLAGIGLAIPVYAYLAMIAFATQNLLIQLACVLSFAVMISLIFVSILGVLEIGPFKNRHEWCQGE